MRLLLYAFLLLITPLSSSFIPRETLCSDTQFVSDITLSPDGKFIGYTAHDENKIVNVFSLRTSDLEKRQLTFEKKDVLSFAWTGVNDIILFEQDNHGDENNMIFKQNISEYAVNIEPTSIYNVRGVKAVIVANDMKKGYVLIGLNNEIPSYHNVYKFDLYSNELTPVFINSRFAITNVFADNDLNIRVAKEDQDDGTSVFYRVSENVKDDKLTSNVTHWVEYIRVQPDDIPFTDYIGFDKANEKIYFLWSDGRNLGDLVIASSYNFTEREELVKATKTELRVNLFHPEDRTILALSENYHKPEFVFMNDTVSGDLEYLANYRSEESLKILSVSNDMDFWIVTYLTSESARKAYIYRRSLSSIELLFNTNKNLTNYKLNKQLGFDFVARDNLTIQAYLSLPPDVELKQSTDVSEEDSILAKNGLIPVEPLKMILRVHGGPHLRDNYGFDEAIAFLTSRGYAVMQVNFRGSSGFGKELRNAGNGEWSRKMHYDLLDAVEFAVAKGIAIQSSVAIMGGSYGGYATLVGLTFTPDTFACGIDFFGVSNLVSFMESIPPYWKAYRKGLEKRIGGNAETEEGRQELIDRSPLFIADRVIKPLLMFHGANDARVKQNESEQFVGALNNHSIPVTYVLFPDEGHGFRRIPNLMASYGMVEKFLHDCLGGEYQSFTDGEYNESAIVMSFGGDLNASNIQSHSIGNYMNSISVIITLVTGCFVVYF